MSEFSRDGISISYDVAGEGPPVLLLHGFPQSRVMWDRIGADLQREFTVVRADLRGYGASSKPRPEGDPATYSFRAMGGDMLALMASLGFERFHLVGHDRGGRVAHRMSLDAPDRLLSLTVMDIVPTLTLLENWTADVSASYFHWSYLAQPAPFAERMIEADPDHFYEACLLGWGGASLEDFEGLAAYRAAWRDPACIAATTADYRAVMAVDRYHDAEDRGRQFDGPALVLFGADGAMAKLFDVAETWAPFLSKMTAKAIPGGHFFPDQSPDETSAALLNFLRG